jgi:hypothetical protein
VASGFNAAIAVKSLVNDDAEIVGVAVLVELGVLVDFELVPGLEELPHAAIPKLAVTASAAITALLLSKYTLSSILSATTLPARVDDAGGDYRMCSLALTL